MLSKLFPIILVGFLFSVDSATVEAQEYQNPVRASVNVSFENQIGTRFAKAVYGLWVNRRLVVVPEEAVYSVSSQIIEVEHGPATLVYRGGGMAFIVTLTSGPLREVPDMSNSEGDIPFIVTSIQAALYGRRTAPESKTVYISFRDLRAVMANLVRCNGNGRARLDRVRVDPDNFGKFLCPQ